MKDIHHITKEACLKHIYNYRQSAYLDLPDGTVIIAGIIDQHYRLKLEAEPGSTPIPPIGSGELMPAHTVKSFSHLGVVKTDDTMKAILKISKAHNAFHPRNL